MALRENRLFTPEPEPPPAPAPEPPSRWRSWFGRPSAAATPEATSPEHSSKPAAEPAPKRRLTLAFDPLAGVDAETKARLRQALGLSIVVLAVFLLTALLSHLASGGADAALTDYGALPDPDTTDGLRPSNSGGSLGAFIGRVLISDGYGLAALLIPPFLGLLGWAVIEDRRWNAVREWGLYLFLALHGASFIFGFWSVLLEAPTVDLAGGVGIAMVHSLRFYIGLVGVGLLQLLLIGGVLTLRFGARVDIGALVRTLTHGAPPPVVESEASESRQRPANFFHVPESPATNGLPDADEALEGAFSMTLRSAAEPDPEAASISSEPLPPAMTFYDFAPEGELEPTPVLKPRLRSGTPKGADDLELVIEAPLGDPAELAPTDALTDNIRPEGEGYVKAIADEDLPSADSGDALSDDEWRAYDPTLELGNYQFPTLELLREHGTPGGGEVNRAELEANKQRILQTLANYNIQISSIKATIGPTVTLYEIVPAPGVRISKIKGLEDDIALSLSALGIRIIAPMPGKGTIGIEIPNSKPEIVSFRSVVATEKFRHSEAELPIAIGRTIANEVYVADLAKMPHLLVAGATQQGKSVGLNCIIASLLYKKHPAHIKFVLIDPKKVELPLYAVLEQHFLAKLPGGDEAVITDNRRVVNVLTSLCAEMDQRYELLKEARVRNLKEYNAKFTDRRLNPRKGHKFLPYIVTIIDELADLMMTAGKEVETPLCRLAQLGRAVGFHLVVATQRPSVNVITGIIKANFPARLSYRVTSKIDSRTILDTNGAEQLVGRGDLLLSTGADLLRIQNAFLDTPEVEKLVHHIGDQQGFSEPYWLPEVKDPQAEEGDEATYDDAELDPLFEESARLVVRTGQGSTSLIQRRLAIGYNRAGRIMDQLEKRGICGPASGSKPREVLVSDEAELERMLGSRGD